MLRSRSTALEIVKCRCKVDKKQKNLRLKNILIAMVNSDVKLKHKYQWNLENTTH